MSDTSFLIAISNRRDSLHEVANQLSFKYSSRRMVTTDAILLELGNALCRSDRQAVISIIRDLQNDPNVTIIPLSDGLMEASLTLYENRPDKQWSLVDCISFVVMEQMGITEALTYDQHFVQAGFTALMREE